ncbi:MAG TPA: peptidoglycan-binding domain-containing protein [Solirubrobacteraceae bacterium]|nr:peptidoglycan-binding domain-containing protein [Solirubrobacteraceae bacterium]
MKRVPRRVGAGLAVVIAIAAVIVVVLAVDSPSPTSGASNGSNSSGAATVQRHNLVETDTESGILSYANPQTVYNRLSGTITWLPSVGQVIKPGGALYKVSGDAVILMNGSTPAYRDLSAADTPGPDILELNRNLVHLGFNPDGIILDDVWQPATSAAVEVFQESLGEEPTGILTLGQVVFLPGNQLVSALETSVGSTGGGSGADSGSSAADRSPTGSSTEFVSLNTTPTPSQKKSESTKTISALLALLKAETAQLKAATAELRAAAAASHSAKKPTGSSPKSGSGSKPSGGGSSNSSGTSDSGGANADAGGANGGSATPILQTSSTQLVATVDLDASKQSEAKVGEKVGVEMPSGTTVTGTVTAVSAVAQSSDNSGNGNGSSGANSNNGGNNGNGSSTPTVPVTITLSGRTRGAGLDQAAVSVQFAQAEANNVLSVPVTALLATSGGAYAVQEAAAPHRLIPVTTGLFAAGFVQISGPGIYPGLQVTDSQG